MDLFDETKVNKVPFEKKKFVEHAIHKHEPHVEKKEPEVYKRSVQAIPQKHHKRYGTKKPDNFRKHEILSWRDDI